MNYEINWNDVNPCIRFEDAINFEAINKINELLIGHKNFDNMAYQIWDFIEVQDLDLSEGDLKIIAALDKSSSIWNKKMKIALVAKNKAVVDVCFKYKESMKDTEWIIDIFDQPLVAQDWCEKEG